MKALLPILLISCLFSCQSYSQPSSVEPVDQKKFNDYWYAGEAELTSFKLEQARYGEIHEGEAVLVFVTEPFSKAKQVKLDNSGDASSDNVSVLKLNFTKSFITGIYPYSMMQSTFVPVSADKHPHALKVTTSSQEWCGHTFLQLNLQRNNYKFTGFSYFESEGDVDKNIEKTILEDELWTRIRLNPSTLPTGELSILPGTFYLRLKHVDAAPQQVTASLTTVEANEFANFKHQKYHLEYADRSLSIYYESDFPFALLGWEETYKSGFGNPQLLTTKAKKINSIKSPYWQKNSNVDRKLRDQLGL